MTDHRAHSRSGLSSAPTDREFVLAKLRERETAIRAELDLLRGGLARLEERQDSMDDDIREAVDQLRLSVERLSSAVLTHVQAEATADHRRDALLGEHSASLAVLASTAGGVAGARSGRGAGAKWGGFVGALVATILSAIWGAINR